MDKFRSHLIQVVHVKEKYVPFYLKWISDCYVFWDLPLEQKINSDQKTEFLRYLAKTNEDWKVKQADYALKLYQYFLSGVERAKVQKDAPRENDWNKLEENMRNSLRLRQKSLSTEKSYIGWMRSQGQ